MWHVLKTGEVHVVFYGETDGKRPLGRPKHRREDKDKMDISEVGRSGIAVAQARDRCQALVKRVMNLRVP
jgi:hypothetical protein